MRKTSILLFILLSAEYHAGAQIWNKINPLKKEDAAANVPSLSEEEIKQLRNDVSALSSEKMEGRKAGTRGEQLAAEYIEKRMQALGIVPPIGKSYRRPFKFPVGREISPESKITVNGKATLIPYEAIPLSFSAAVEDENYVLPDSRERNTIWLEPLYKSDAEAKNPAFNWEQYTYETAQKAADRGASSVVFYDSYGSAYFPQFKKESAYNTAASIPVWAVTQKVYEEHIKDMRTMRPIVLNTKFRTEYGNGINLAGFINNGAKSTVIIAAHYDHKGNATVNGKRETYPGANDNASGVASLLALASKIRQAQFKNYNYLFMTFSAEEEGALGSKAFVDERDFKGKSIAYMINLDEIGLLDAERSLTVAGLGTAPEFRGMVQALPGNFKLRKENLGKSESDHKTFYGINVPFLYLSANGEQDSGTKGDNIGNMNFKGLADITMYAFNIVSAMEKLPMPVFTKTKDEVIIEQPKPVTQAPSANIAPTTGPAKAAATKPATKKEEKATAKVAPAKENKLAKEPAKAAKENKSTKEKATVQQMQQPAAPKATPVYKVSLGVSPDLNYTEGGVRIATVSAGRAADKAGIQDGDIIIQMRDMPIQTYDNYLEALAKFNKGQKTIIKVKRDGKLQSYPVVFQ